VENSGLGEGCSGLWEGRSYLRRGLVVRYLALARCYVEFLYKWLTNEFDLRAQAFLVIWFNHYNILYIINSNNDAEEDSPYS
jgi:hypothetical protein